MRADPALPRIPYRPTPPVEYRAEPYFMPAGEADGMDLFRKLWRRRNTILLGAGVGAVLAAAVAFTLPPRYKAESQVLIGVELPNITGLPSILQEMTANQEVVQSQSYVLQSRSLGAQVAHRLALDQDPEFNPALRETPAWKQAIDDVKSFVRAGVVGSLRDLGVLGPEEVRPEPTPEQIAKRREEIVVSQLLSRITVTPLQRSHVLSIAAESMSPDTATRIANTVANTYIEQQLIRRAKAAQNANQWLDQRIVELREKVESSERATEEYRRKHGLFETRNDQLTAQQLTELNTQLIMAQSERASAEARLQQAEQVKRNQAPAESLPEIVNSPLIQALKQRQAEIHRQAAELGSTFGPQHPRMLDMRAQLKDINTKISAEMEGIVGALRHEVQAARARVSSLQSSLAGLQSDMGTVNEKSIQLRELERQAEANRRLLVNFLDRARETDAQPNPDEKSSVVISEATVPLAPSFPPTTMLILLGLVGGSLVGTMTGLMRENLDRTFRTARQVEEATNLPILGVVPPSDRSVLDGSSLLRRIHTPYSQAISNLYERLVFAPDAQAHKVVMVTSATPREGKTRIATSLVRLVAHSGLRVIILDCDWRRPAVHTYFQRPVAPGLGDLLAGVATPDEVVYRDQDTGVHAIFAGDVSLLSNSAERFARLRMLLATLAKHYDLVIMDTPPVLAGADALALARMAEEIAFVIKWGRVSRDVAVDAIKHLTFAGGRFRGVVLTDVDPKMYRRYGMGDVVYPYPASHVTRAA